jgi:hypothetical protein
VVYVAKYNAVEISRVEDEGSGGGASIDSLGDVQGNDNFLS